MIFINGKGCAFVNDNADASIRMHTRAGNEGGDMKEAQSSARSASAADIRSAGRLSVYELFAAQVQRDPHALAIEQGSLRRSYGVLDARVVRLAAALHAKGVRYGDRVAILSENRAEYIELELAAVPVAVAA